MAIYAIGDVQGCYEELAKLLDRLNLDTAADELWFVGDLVNRGPDSVAVLQLVMSLGNSATDTLGNHDLHLLALAYGRRAGTGDEKLSEVLRHEDSGEIIRWLRQRPLAHYRPDLNTLMVHAGVISEWDPLLTIRLAREVEEVLKSDDCGTFLQSMYGERPNRWSDRLQNGDRLRFIVNCLTRIRYCHRDGRLDFTCKQAPGDQPPELTPWFDLPDRAAESVRIVFGHWASLGLIQRENLIGIDTGCVWGRELTAVRLDGPAHIVSVPANRR